MPTEIKLILDPASVRDFILTVDIPEDEDFVLGELKDGLTGGAFIATVTSTELKPGLTSHNLEVTGLNGKIIFLGEGTDPASFVSRLTSEVLKNGKDTSKADTVVLFRKSVDGFNDVTAVFPFEEAIRNQPYMGCYGHVGQHSSCHLDWVTETTVAATPEEYADLKRELESAPFNYKFLVLDDLVALGFEEMDLPTPTP